MALPLIPIVGTVLASFAGNAAKFLLPWLLIEGVKILGITLVTFGAIDLLTDSMSNFIYQKLNDFPLDVYNMLAKAGFIDAIDILLAGWVAQIALRNTMGAFSRMKFTPNT